jgi:hypothetical protein
MAPLDCALLALFILTLAFTNCTLTCPLTATPLRTPTTHETFPSTASLSLPLPLLPFRPLRRLLLLLFFLLLLTAASNTYQLVRRQWRRRVNPSTACFSIHAYLFRAFHPFSLSLLNYNHFPENELALPWPLCPGLLHSFIHTNFH